MPPFRPGSLQQGQRGLRRPDGTGLDQPPRGLQARAKHGVRCAADADPGAFGLLEQRAAGGDVEGQRLLAPHVLAGRDRGGGHLGVRGGDGQVHDQLDAGVASAWPACPPPGTP